MKILFNTDNRNIRGFCLYKDGLPFIRKWEEDFKILDFMTKDFQKAIYTRSILKNKMNKNPTIKNITVYKRQRNLCVSLRRKNKIFPQQRYKKGHYYK